jgi:hypothetical protein
MVAVIRTMGLGGVRKGNTENKNIIRVY